MAQRGPPDYSGETSVEFCSTGSEDGQGQPKNSAWFTLWGSCCVSGAWCRRDDGGEGEWVLMRSPALGGSMVRPATGGQWGDNGSDGLAAGAGGWPLRWATTG